MPEKLTEFPTILIAEDDPDDRLIIKEALEESSDDVKIEFVNDGEALIERLNESLKSKESKNLPQIILLDLNMPKIDGREALRFVKSHPVFKMIPTMVLTTSRATEDVESTYEMGVNSFFTKPASFQEMVVLTEQIRSYWFQTAVLPVK